MRYLATTSNEQYSGKMCGIQFKEGRAVVDEYTLDKSLGRDVEETARMLTQDFGVTVKRITRDIEVEDLGDAEFEPAPALPAAPAKVGKKGGRRKAASPAVQYGPQEGV